MPSHSFRATQKTEEHLLYIKSALGVESLSEAICASIEAHYQQLKNHPKESKSPIEIFEELGLVGSIEADSDLSMTYKIELEQSIKNKHASDK